MKHRNNAAARLRETIIFILVLFSPVPAFAVSTVAISSTGDGVFLIQGSGIEDAAALEIVLSYDMASLTNPRVLPGPLIAGAMTAINPNIPGTVRMAIIRLTPLSGSGVIATITFDLKGSGPGAINAMSVKLANIDGTSLPALVEVDNPGPSASGSQDEHQAVRTPGTSESDSSSPPSSPVVAVGPSSRVYEENNAEDVYQERDRSAPPATSGSAVEPPGQESENTASAAEQEQKTAMAEHDAEEDSAQSKAVYRQQSVLDRFREYRGERSARAFLTLFGRESSMIGCRQEPPVALSDGKTTVKVAFIAAPGDKSASDIAVMGARLISMKRDSENTNTWIVELLPEKGTFRASLALSVGAVQIIYPLTVAPEVDGKHGLPGRLTREDLDRYVKQRPSDPARNGGMNYIEDYIFTANYLADTYRSDQTPASNSRLAGQ